MGPSRHGVRPARRVAGGAGGGGVSGGGNTPFVFGGPTFLRQLCIQSFLKEKLSGENSGTEKHSSPRNHLLTAVFITWSSSPRYLSVGHLITSR